MVLKISYLNQIHRLSKTPASYQELVKLVGQLFQTQLPERWTLQYLDSDGDSIMLSDEHDYQNLLEGELNVSVSSAKAVKIFVIPTNELNESRVKADESVSEEKELRKEEDEFQIIEKQESIVREAPRAEEPKVEEPKVEVPEVEVPKVEEKVQEEIQVQPEVENKVVEPVPEEVQQEVVPEVLKRSVVPEEPQAEVQKVEEAVNVPEPVEERRRKCHRGMHAKFHVKKYLKKLARSSLSPRKRERVQQKFENLKATLTPEQLEKVNAKQEKYARKAAEKKALKDQEFKEKVTEVIYQYLPTIASLTKEYVQEENNKAQPNVQAQPQPDTQVVHSGVRCDGCDTYPLTGVRYKCSVCPDFDFCEKCEANTEHAHPFIKIRNPQQAVPHRRGPPHHGRGFFGQPPHQGGRGFGGHCPDISRGWFCQKPANEQEKQEYDNFEKKIKDFKGSDGFKNLIGSFLGMNNNVSAENQEKMEKDVESLFKEAPEKLRNVAAEKFENMPESYRSHFNQILRGLPEKLLGKKNENNQEEKIQEQPKVENPNSEKVIIEEEPVVNEIKAQVHNNNGPLIQEVEKVEPKVQKHYPAEVTEKVVFLMEIFPDAKEEDLLEFVAKTPKMSIQDLIENYLAL